MTTSDNVLLHHSVHTERCADHWKHKRQKSIEMTENKVQQLSYISMYSLFSFPPRVLGYTAFFKRVLFPLCCCFLASWLLLYEIHNLLSIYMLYIQHFSTSFIKCNREVSTGCQNSLILELYRILIIKTESRKNSDNIQ